MRTKVHRLAENKVHWTAMCIVPDVKRLKLHRSAMFMPQSILDRVAVPKGRLEIPRRFNAVDVCQKCLVPAGRLTATLWRAYLVLCGLLIYPHNIDFRDTVQIL